MPTLPLPAALLGTVQIDAQNVQLRENVVLDEVHLEGSAIRLEAPARAGEAGRLSAEETRFRVTISEGNLNRLLVSSLPPDVPVKNLRVALFSGKARFTGQWFIVPISLEAVPRVENGVHPYLDFQAGKLGQIGIPPAVVEAIEQQVNRGIAQALDLNHLPVPVWLDALQCEPGRVTALGRTRIAWPPTPAIAPITPFSACERPLAAGEPAALIPSGEPPALAAPSETAPVLPPAKP